MKTNASVSRWFRAMLCGLAFTVPVQAGPAGYSEYLIPFGAEQLWSIMTNMDNDPVLTTAAPGATTGGLHCVIGISIGTPNTTVYYDHWEDGLDFDPNNPATADETFIGATRGQVIKLESSNIPVPTRGTTVKYDGRDRIYVAGGAVTITMSYWPESIGTVYADAWEIYPTKQFQTAYTIPVGEDLAGGTTNYEDFNRCYIVVQASENATTVTIDDPLVAGVQVSTTLNKGEVTQYLRSNSGTTINSNKPVQVQYVTGQPQAGQYSECRGYTAVPSTIWDTKYFCPVPSGGNADADGNNYRTEIYIQNPTASPLAIRWRDSTGTGTANVPANSTRSFTSLFGHSIPTNSGASIEAVDGVTKFNAIGSGNSLNITGNANANYDFGFSLVPANLLRSEYFLGWAPGTRTLANNGSPAFITPVNDATTIFVDWNADGIPEDTQTLNSLQVLKARDTTDNDNSGMRITATGPIAVVWGEDAVLADVTDPYLDVGYSVIPQLEQNLDIVLSADKTANPTSVPKGIGQTSTFTLVTRTGGYTLDDVRVVDTLPAGWAYVAGSTIITLPGGTTITGANANPSISGQVLTWNDFSPGVPPNPDPLDMLANQTLTITFQGITTSTSATGFSNNQMASTGTRGAQTFTATSEATVYVADLSVVKASSAGGSTSPGSQITYTMTLSNLGSRAQNNIIVSDPLPAGTSYVSQSTTVTIPAATGNYRDEFAAASYSNTNGNVDWSGAPWVESGDNNNVASGKVQITGGLLRFGGVNADTSTDEVTRVANMSTFGTISGATLTFNLTNSANLESADTMTVQYSPDGTTWTTFTGGSFAGNAATGAQSFSIPLAAIGAGTRIRFQVAGLGDGTTEFINVDNVNVAFTTTASTRDNIPGGANPDLSNGVPPNLVAAADSLDILVPGGTMVVTFRANVNNPTPANQASVVNTVTITSVEQPAAVSSTVTDQLPPVTIGDFVFNDTNANGIQDSGETGINGVRVNLYRPGYGPDGIPGNTDDNDVVATTLTAGGGLYSLTRPPGSYFVEFAPLSGYARSPLDQGSDDTKDSDANGTTGRTGTVALTSGQSNQTLDAGYVALASIGDFVWNDANANGQHDGGEAGLGGVLVTLKDGSGNDIDSDPGLAGVQPTTTTSAAVTGAYSFTGLYPGTYQVEFGTLSGYNRTLADQGADGTDSDANAGTGRTATFSLAAGETNNTIDAGYFQPVTIGDFVWIDTNANGQQDSGEAGLDGVTVTLYRPGFGPDGIADTADDADAVATSTTSGGGAYSFSGLPPGTYQVEFGTLSGYSRTLADNGADGTDSDANAGTGLTATISLAAGETNNTIDAGYYQPASIGNLVWRDANHNGIYEAGTDWGLNGITVQLYQSGQTPGVDTPVATQTTTGGGGYQFTDLAPGSYFVYLPTHPASLPAVTSPSVNADNQIDNDNNGSQSAFAGPVTGPVIQLGSGESDQTIDIGYACQGTWEEWQYLNALGGENGATDNPEDDRRDNLLEFSLREDPSSGIGDGFEIRPSTTNPGTIEAVFNRPIGATKDVRYVLEYAATLGTPTVWSQLDVSGLTVVITPLSACTEQVIIPGLEAITGLEDGKGFVRIRVELDEDGDDTPEAISLTETEGWTETAVELCCRTYNVPYLRGPLFTGTVGSVSGQSMVFPGENLDNLLASGISYYVEVTSGDNEGHRYDVVSTAGETITLANDSDLFAATAPYNTALGALPTDLAGDTIILRRHWTLGEIFPPSGFGATDSSTTADMVQIHVAGGWQLYWLYDEGDANPATARWVKVGDNTLSNQGTQVVPPGQGMFLNSRTTVSSLLAYGEVRENDFRRPLQTGPNLVGGGYPMDQSLNGTGGRNMNLTANFDGDRDFKKADRVMIWQQDTNPAAGGYDTYFLLHGAPVQPALVRWVKVGDVTIQVRDATTLFPGDRSAFYQMMGALPGDIDPAPWTP